MHDCATESILQYLVYVIGSLILRNKIYNITSLPFIANSIIIKAAAGLDRRPRPMKPAAGTNHERTVLPIIMRNLKQKKFKPQQT